MKVFQINGGVVGSTGKIMFNIAASAEKHGHEVLCAAPITSTNRNPISVQPYERIGSYYSRCMNVLMARMTGMEGCFSYLTTVRLLKKIMDFQPDVIHLHSIHNSYLNISMLFRYIKRRNIRVIWTLHDCWSFTGQCPHFTLVGCDKWKTGCHHCPQHRSYPATYVDRTKTMWRLKKKWFTGVEDLTIITPSRWLADLVKESFLKDYPVKVIHNGIDLDIFKPTPSDFRAKHGIPARKKILLGVAFGWGVRKGLDVFVELEKRLDPDKYQIVLVGTDDQTDRQLPPGILSIHRTQNQQELAEIYTAADLFVNPTREENYPTVNMESIACGTPVVTFRTGGSPEIPDETTGAVVPCDDIDALEQEIHRICTDQPFSQENCLKRARDFDMNERFEEYVEMYSIF